MTDTVRVMNFDGLVGPTHNYAGLSHGNVASAANANKASRPRDAVLQGLEKMAFVASLGVPQGLLPPLERPRIEALRRLGFLGGTDAETLDRAYREAPALLAAVWSASSMWTANAATVTASADADDGRVHFTPANLSSKFHRSLEAPETARHLRLLFEGDHFMHHAPLDAALGDEGAANHTRMAGGVDLFVWGRVAMGPADGPRRFPARQALEASEAVARRHGCRRPVFIQQSPEAIDAGAFHNDVVCVGHGNLLLVHEKAFAETHAIDRIRRVMEDAGAELRAVVVRDDELPLKEAVATYLFNSQIVDGPDGPVLIAPAECEHHSMASVLVERWLDEGVFAAAHFLDFRQSMRNGGGPACLRLRVPLTSEERDAVHPGIVFTADLHEELKAWAEKHYREHLLPEDLTDPLLVEESIAALDALTPILKLGVFYEFQRRQS